MPSDLDMDELARIACARYGQSADCGLHLYPLTENWTYRVEGEAARSWVRPSWFRRPRWDLSTTLGDRPHWGPWQSSVSDAVELHQLERLARVVTERLRGFGDRDGRFGLVHADLRLANLLVDGDHITVIDFEDCGLSWYLYDLACALTFNEGRSDVRELIALWVDGYRAVEPLAAEDELVSAYVCAARDLGVTVATHAAVTGIEVRGGAVSSVSTAAGRYRTEQVIIAAGPWSGALARLVGLELPIVPVLHEYFVTEPVPGWHAGLPCLRIPEVQVYARGERDRVLCGGFENCGTSIDPRSVTVVSRLAAGPDWEVLGGFAESLSGFAPSVADAGVAATFRGWPAFSPDGRFVVGPVSAVRGVALAAGCNAHGVSGSAGLAMHLVESLGGDASPYVRSLSPDRFIPRTWSWEDARVQAQAVYENYYPMPVASLDSRVHGGQAAVHVDGDAGDVARVGRA